MRIYAHRGARGYAPENTMAAFRLALELGADGIELDVQATKDGAVVICHDHTIDRTSNGTGWIRDYTLAELRALDFGGWFSPEFVGEALPTFAEFFAWYVTTPLYLNVEIKNGPAVYPGIERKLIAEMQEIMPLDFPLYDRLIFSSFYHPSLCEIKTLDLRFKTGVLFDDRPVDVAGMAKQINAEYLHPHWHYLEQEWVQAAHDAGIGVNSYTVNTREEYEFARAAGIDGIFSDFPDHWRKR